MGVENQQQKVANKPMTLVPPHAHANAARIDSSAKGESSTERSSDQSRPTWKTNIPPPTRGPNIPQHTSINATSVNQASASTASATPQNALQRHTHNFENLKQPTHEAQVKVELAATAPASVIQANEDDSVPETQSYEEYDLRSEDDAFFANVDLGDGDSGIGGPIDFEEDTSRLDHEDQQPPLLEAAQQPASTKHESLDLLKQNPHQSSRHTRLLPQDKGALIGRDPSPDNTAVRTSNTPVRLMGGFNFPPGFVCVLSKLDVDLVLTYGLATVEATSASSGWHRLEAFGGYDAVRPWLNSIILFYN
jgi:hypothetical protein